MGHVKGSGEVTSAVHIDIEGSSAALQYGMLLGASKKRDS